MSGARRGQRLGASVHLPLPWSTIFLFWTSYDTCMLSPQLIFTVCGYRYDAATALGMCDACFFEK